MSNLKTARQTIEAELEHVEKGIAFYQAKASALKATLMHIEQAESGMTANTPRKQRASSAASVTRTTPQKQRGRKAGTRNTGSTLPRMTRTYWLEFISHEPKTAVDIINAALASFDAPLDPTQTRKLKQRATQALQALLGSKQIKDVGAGRQRRYFLPLGKSSASDKAGVKVKTSAADIGGTILH